MNSVVGALLVLLLVTRGDVINFNEPQILSQKEFGGWTSIDMVSDRQHSYHSGTAVRANNSSVPIHSTLMFTHVAPRCTGIRMTIVTVLAGGGLPHAVDFFDNGTMTVGKIVRKITYKGRLVQDEVKTTVSIDLASLENSLTFAKDLKAGEKNKQRLHVTFNYLGSEYMKTSYSLDGISRAENYTVTQCFNSTDGIWI